MLYALPDPEDLGMDPQTTWLSVLTELLDVNLSEAEIRRDDLAEPAERSDAPLEVWWPARSAAPARVHNFQRSFTYVEEGDWVVGGVAASVSEQAPTAPTVMSDVEPLSVRLFETGGRVFLSEDVPVSVILRSAEQVFSAVDTSSAHEISLHGSPTLPPTRPTAAGTSIASARPQAGPAFVVDYCDYYGTVTNNLRFQKGETYFISSELVVSGARLTIEPGTVVKLATNASIILQSAARLECLYYTNLPAIFTSVHDTSAGEAIPDYTNSPAQNKYAAALDMRSGTNRVWGLEIRYAQKGLVFAAPGAQHDARDNQVFNSDRAIEVTAGWTILRIRHLLVSNALVGVWARTNSISVSLCTFDGVGAALWVTTGVTSLSVNDSLFVDVATNLVSNGVVSVGFTYNAALNATNGWLGSNLVTLASRPFEGGEQGSHYLLRSATNIIDHGSGAWPYTMNWYHHTTATNHAKESNTVIDIGFHYPAPTDSDGDGLCDYWEDAYGNASYWSVQDESNWQDSDTDDDGLSDGAEVRLYWTNPKVQDTDGDGQNDKLEVDNGSDPNDPASFLTTISGTIGYSGGQTGLIRVLALYEPGLMLEYSFDEDEGGVILDTSGHGRDGELFGAQFDPNGKIGGGLTLDGTNHYAELDGGLPLAGHSFTLAVWARPNASQQPCCESGRQDIFSMGVGQPEQGLQFGYEWDGYFLVHFWDDGLFSDQSYADDGQWHHWGATYEQTTKELLLYRDGTVVGSDTTADDFMGTGTLVIARGAMSPFTVSYFGGVLDEVQAYDRALSATDMTNLFVRGHSALITYTAVVESAGSYTITNADQA